MSYIRIKCSASGKAVFPTKERAADAMSHERRRNRATSNHGARLPVRVYECEDCGFWHMTARPVWHGPTTEET